MTSALLSLNRIHVHTIYAHSAEVKTRYFSAPRDYFPMLLALCPLLKHVQSPRTCHFKKMACVISENFRMTRPKAHAQKNEPAQGSFFNVNTKESPENCDNLSRKPRPNNHVGTTALLKLHVLGSLFLIACSFFRAVRIICVGDVVRLVY